MEKCYLRQTDRSDVEYIQGWFANDRELFYWGGPGLDVGLSSADFYKKIKVDEVSSYSLTDGEKLQGFGQFYERLGRHHLSRIAISPLYRGRGLSSQLIKL